MARFPPLIALIAILLGLAAATARAQETIYNNVGDGDVGGGYIVGTYPDSGGDYYTIGFDFTVPQGPDVQFDQGEFLASTDPGLPSGDVNLQILSSGGATLDSMIASGLTDTAAPISFNSTSNPTLYAGQQYWLTATMVDSANSALWWTPATPDPGTEISNINGGPLSTYPLPRGAFSLTGTPTQWQTHFAGSATIGGTGMQNAVMVFESFDANGNVLNKGHKKGQKLFIGRRLPDWVRCGHGTEAA